MEALRSTARAVCDLTISVILSQAMAEKEKLRLDKYLWAIRIFKTRSMAAAACDSGKVKQHGTSVKASKNVAVGDEYEVKTEEKRWIIKVTGLLPNRVAYALAINYYLDLTPQEELDRMKFQASSFHTGKRQSKIGRPTKKQRRELDDFLGEDEDRGPAS
jgi:ribosome-associated heat shock protein Hsp15